MELVEIQATSSFKLNYFLNNVNIITFIFCFITKIYINGKHNNYNISKVFKLHNIYIFNQLIFQKYEVETKVWYKNSKTVTN